MSAAVLLADFGRRGFTIRAGADGLTLSPASALTPEDRAAVRAHRDELIALLSPAEPWDQRAALKLMADADEWVARLGVSGHHPDVWSAAATVATAFVTRDLETVRFVVSEFVAVVRRIATARKGVAGCHGGAHGEHKSAGTMLTRAAESEPYGSA